MNATRMVLKTRDLGELFPSATSAHYVEEWQSEDGVVKIHKIWASGAPGSNYDEAAIGSEYVDTATGKLYMKTGASAWTVAGAQT